jgi:ribosomal protein S18 acetylase RimI-like enzyme
VRDAVRADIPSIVAWQIAMALETESMYLDPDVVLRGVTKVFDDVSIGYYLIAEIDHKPCASMLVLSEWSDWRAGFVLWLHSVFVEKQARGSGVFRALYSEIVNRVEENPDFKGIRLYVDKTNTSAQNVYRKLKMSRDHYDLFEWMKS